MYPRKIVDKALRLHTDGWTDRAVAQACGVSIRAVRHWRKGQRRDPETKTARTERTTYCPTCHGRALNTNAYSYLLGLYLGDGHITNSYRTRTCCLWVFCDDRYPNLIQSCGEAMEAVLPVRAFHAPRPGCTAVKSASKHWPCLFPQHGPGPKHTRAISLAPWQAAVVAEYPEGFVRGLFHSDGCRIVNQVRRTVAGADKWYEYPRYFFSNNSHDIHGLLGRYLDQLGVEWRMSNATTLSVAKRASVARLDAFVGPKR